MSQLITHQPELALVPGAEPLMPAMSIEQAIARYNMMVKFAQSIMRPGRDYGVIPGTGKQRDGEAPRPEDNVLLKPGAEKLCSLFGLTPVFERDSVIEDFERGIFYYSYNCILLRHARRQHHDGKAIIAGDYVGSGIGSANSRERKYRRGNRACPDCGAGAIKRSGFPKNVPAAQRGWYCHDKAGGCGATFAADDQRILDAAPVLDGVEACDLVNTLQKMAQKRALIAATLIATNASEFFTQDVDDIELARETPIAEQGEGEGDDYATARPASSQAARPQPPQPEPRVGPAFVEGMNRCIGEHGLSLKLVLAHYGIRSLAELPLSKAQDARDKCKGGYAGWKEPTPPKPERPAGPEQLKRIADELWRVGIAGDELARMLERYNVARVEDLLASQAQMLLTDLEELSAATGKGKP